MTAEPIRVALVDDDELLRGSLAVLVGGTAGFECAGSYPTLEAALRGLDRQPVDLVLLDVDLPGMAGPEGVEYLRRLDPPPQVVMFTVYAEDDLIFASLMNGACGYLLKDTPPERLLTALSEAHHGGAPMSARIARRVLRLFRRVAPPPAARHDLTEQEVRLLGLLAEGYTYQGAAEQLFVSINTVRSHVRSIYDKLHVHSRSQAVHQALKRGIL